MTIRKKGSKVTKNWTQRVRTINGKRQEVKVRKVSNREQVRKLNYVNYSDTKRRVNKKRK